MTWKMMVIHSHDWFPGGWTSTEPHLVALLEKPFWMCYVLSWFYGGRILWQNHLWNCWIDISIRELPGGIAHFSVNCLRDSGNNDVQHDCLLRSSLHGVPNNCWCENIQRIPRIVVKKHHHPIRIESKTLYVSNLANKRRWIPNSLKVFVLYTIIHIQACNGAAQW